VLKCALPFAQVELPNSKDHETGRNCPKCGCALYDNIVHFGEALPWSALTMANAKFLGADLSIAIGTSLQVEPAASLPFKSKRRKKNPPRPRAVVINLQPTRLDGEADLVIRARSDEVLSRICRALNL
jgi:NAD-dependent deacetylase